MKMLELDSGPQVPTLTMEFINGSHVMAGDWKIWQAKHLTNASVELHERQLVRMGMSFDDFQKLTKSVLSCRSR